MAIQGLKRGMALQASVWLQTGVTEAEVRARIRAGNPDLTDRDLDRVIDQARVRVIDERPGRHASLRGEATPSVGFRRFLGWLMSGGRVGAR